MKTKRFCLLIPALLLLTLLSACGSGSKAEPLPAPERLREELEPVFSDELSETEPSIGRYLYGIDEGSGEEFRFWMSSGGTVEELTLIRCGDAQSAEAMLKAVRKRCERQKATYESYAPKELPKLEKAFARSNGEWVVLCVSDRPEEAEKLLSRYFPK